MEMHLFEHIAMNNKKAEIDYYSSYNNQEIEGGNKILVLGF